MTTFFMISGYGFTVLKVFIFFYIAACRLSYVQVPVRAPYFLRCGTILHTDQ